MRSYLRERKKKKVQKSNRLGLYGSIVGVICVCCCVALVLFARAKMFRISEITITGNTLVTDQEIVDAVFDTITGTRWMFVPRSHTFFISKRVLEHELLGRLPRIESLTIRRTSFSSIAVKISERGHAYIWCSEKTSKNCYFTDTTGRVFAKAPYFSGNVFLTFFGGDVDNESPIETHILKDADALSVILDHVSYFSDNGFRIEAVDIKNNQEFSLIVSWIQETQVSGTKILLHTLVPKEQALSNILIATTTDRFKQQLLAKPSLLAYIDARLPEKVFYTFNP